MTDVWRYELTEPAERDLRRLDMSVRRRIFTALDSYLASGGHGDVRKLAGSGNEYRLRVGDWRIRFAVRIDTRPAELPVTGTVREALLPPCRRVPAAPADPCADCCAIYAMGTRMLQEGPALLHRATDYLERHQTAQPC